MKYQKQQLSGLKAKVEVTSKVNNQTYRAAQIKQFYKHIKTTRKLYSDKIFTF